MKVLVLSQQFELPFLNEDDGHPIFETFIYGVFDSIEAATLYIHEWQDDEIKLVWKANEKENIQLMMGK